MVSSFVYLLPLADFELRWQGKVVVIETVMVKPWMFTVCPLQGVGCALVQFGDLDSCPGSF